MNPTRTIPAQFAPEWRRPGALSPGLSLQVVEEFGEHGRSRTCNLRIKSPLLCQLSYVPSGERLSLA